MPGERAGLHLPDILPLLHAEGWRLMARGERSLYLQDIKADSRGTWRVHDNGGEWGVERVNDEAATRRDFPSGKAVGELDGGVPTHEGGFLPLDRGTMAWRVLMALRGLPIDWAYRCPELIDDEPTEVARVA